MCLAVAPCVLVRFVRFLCPPCVDVLCVCPGIAVAVGVSFSRPLALGLVLLSICGMQSAPDCLQTCNGRPRAPRPPRDATRTRARQTGGPNVLCICTRNPSALPRRDKCTSLWLELWFLFYIRLSGKTRDEGSPPIASDPTRNDRTDHPRPEKFRETPQNSQSSPQ